jgi:hypothetical protein
MVEMNITYLGQLRCEAVHGPSGTKIITDAPVDNCGRGEAFSPTDLTCASLATCILTTMGIKAQQLDLNLEGMRAKVSKEMSTTPAPAHRPHPDRPASARPCRTGPAPPPRIPRPGLPRPPQPQRGRACGRADVLGRLIAATPGHGGCGCGQIQRPIAPGSKVRVVQAPFLRGVRPPVDAVRWRGMPRPATPRGKPRESRAAAGRRSPRCGEDPVRLTIFFTSKASSATINP